MKKYLFIVLLVGVCFFGCVIPGTITLKYQISTHTNPSKNIKTNNPTFDVKYSKIKEDEIAERKIANLIIDHLTKKGWKQQSLNPKYLISADFSIDDGQNKSYTRSRPVTTTTYNWESGTSKQHVTQQTSTQNIQTYERKIILYIYDGNNLVWEGKVISRGTTQDLFYIAPYLIPEIVDRIGQKDILVENTKTFKQSMVNELDANEKTSKKPKKKTPEGWNVE